jgi:hypothetical protein
MRGADIGARRNDLRAVGIAVSDRNEREQATIALHDGC